MTSNTSQLTFRLPVIIDVSHENADSGGFPSFVKMLFSYGSTGNFRNAILYCVLRAFSRLEVQFTESTLGRDSKEALHSESLHFFASGGKKNDCPLNVNRNKPPALC